MDLKIIYLFILISSVFISASSAETIVGSTMELVNDSGSFTWTSQNFPALKAGDTLEINIINNTIECCYDGNGRHIGLLYTLNSYLLPDADNIFPPTAKFREDYNGIKCLNYLSNDYCEFSGGNFKVLTPYKADTNFYTLYIGDTLKLNENKEFRLFQADGSGAWIIFDAARPSQTSYNFVVAVGALNMISYDNDVKYLLIYVDKTYNDRIEIKGIVQFFLNPTYNVNFGTNRTYGKLSNFGLDITHNSVEIKLMEGSNDITKELKIMKNGNKIYPSANIIKTPDLNIQYIPKPISTPTPTTPIQTPMLTSTITSTNTPTPFSTVTPTITPTYTPIVTPTITQTISATSIPTSPIGTSNLEQEDKEIEKPLNVFEGFKNKPSWLESTIRSLLGWFNSIF